MSQQIEVADFPRSHELAPETIRQNRRWAMWLFGIALSVRLVTLGLTFHGNSSVEYYDDAKIALNIVGGHGFSIDYGYRNFLLYSSLLNTKKLEDPINEGVRVSAVKQPAYALLLAGLFKIFGAKNFVAVFLLHAVISSLTVSLLFLCLARAAPIAGLVAGFGMAIYPPFFGHPVTVPESTTLVLFLITSLLLCLIKIKESGCWTLWLLFGALGSLLVLSEPITLTIVAIAVTYAAYLDHRPKRDRLTGVAMAATMMALLLSPWLIRNYVVFHRFPVLKTGAMGHVFVWGLKFSGTGSWISDDQIIALEKAGRTLNELQEEDAIQRTVLASLPDHWREYVFSDIPRHFLNLWWDVPDYRHDYSLRYMLARRIPFIVLLCLAIPHLFRTVVALMRQPVITLNRGVLEVSTLILMLGFTGVYSLVGAFHSRYRLPLELALFVFAAGTLCPFVENLWGQSSSRSEHYS